MNKYSYWKLQIQSVPESWMGLNNKSSFLNDCIETFAGFCLSFPALSILLYYSTKDMRLIYKWLPMLFVLLAMAYFRNFIKRDLVHHGLHILFWAITYLLCFYIWEKLFIMAYIFVATMMSFSKRKRSQITYFDQRMLFFGCLLLFIEYVASVLLKIKPVQIIVIFSTIAFCLSCIIYYNITRTKKLLEWEKQTSKEDMKRVNSSSRRFVGSIATVTAIFTFVFWMAGAFRGSDFVFKDSWLYKLMAFILGLIFKPSNKTPEAVPQDTPGQPMGGLGLPEGGEGPAFLEYIMKILEYLSYVLAALIVLLVVFYILRAIYRRLRDIMYGSRHVEEKMEETSLDLEGMLENLKGRFDSIRSGMHLNFDRTNNGRIRKLYYRIVMKSKRQETAIRHSYTPWTIKEIIKEDSSRDIADATEIYERARYGKDECTREDLTRIKSYK